MAHVLLVEDNPAMLETLSFALRSKGHRVVTASNGEEGMESFLAHKFDLVVTDIILPNMDGLGLIEAMRSAVPNIKILAISGGGKALDFDFLDAARQYGAVSTLEKPFSMSELHDVVDRCSKEQPLSR